MQQPQDPTFNSYDSNMQQEPSYEYYQRPIGSEYSGQYQQQQYYSYPPQAQEHTLVLKQELPAEAPIENSKKSASSSRRVFWGIVFVVILVICAAAVLTGIFVSKQNQQNKNSVVDQSSSSQDAAPGSSLLPSNSGSSTGTLSRTATATTTSSSSNPTSTATASNNQTSSNNNVNQPTSGLPKNVGNCLSGSFPFTNSRTAYSGYSGGVDASFNTGAYDFIVPYNPGNVQMDGSLKINMVRNSGSAASGSMLTTTRYMWYGKFSVTIQAINVGGAITNFITMSDSGDEIDIEICGRPVAPYTNVFYDTVGKSDAQKEYFSHFDIINGIDMSVPHTYTIDWKHDSLTWLVDGVTVRTLLKSQSISSQNPSGPKWFPVTPSLIQFGVWDASFAADPRTVDWAGGPIQWGGNSQFTATYSNFQVTCYDPNDNPVAKWP